MGFFGKMAMERDFRVENVFFSPSKMISGLKMGFGGFKWPCKETFGLKMGFWGEMAMQRDFWVKDGVWEKIAVQRDFGVKDGV